jgi:hypothetical protein
MATRTLSALFEDYSAARRAVERLEAAGFPAGDISVIGRDRRADSLAASSAYGSTTGTTTTTTGTTTSTSSTDATTGYASTDSESGDNAATGATLGAVLGGGAGLLAGVGMLAIPGLGPVVAAGWLASTLAGAVAGGATGGVIGALTGAGVPEDQAHEYAEGIRRGGTLVTVRAVDGPQVQLAADILDDEGTIDMDERSASWRSEGWSGRYGDDTTTGTGLSQTGTTVPGDISGTGGSTMRPTSVPPMSGSTTDTDRAGDVPRGRRVRSYPLADPDVRDDSLRPTDPTATDVREHREGRDRSVDIGPA